MGVCIGIFSPKGGVGKTLLATNLAVAIGVGHHRKTILIDLNKGNGTADLLLNIDPEKSWADLIPVISELTPELINFAVAEYRPGLVILASPPEINSSDELKLDTLSLLLDSIKREYDLVLLDAPASNDKFVCGILSLVDIQLFVITPDLPSLRSISRLIAVLQDKEKVSGLVINQYSPGAPINPDQIKDHLDQPLFGVLPMDPAGAWTNISYGEPCVLRKSSKLGRSIRQLSVKLLKIIDQKESQEVMGE